MRFTVDARLYDPDHRTSNLIAVWFERFRNGLRVEYPNDSKFNTFNWLINSVEGFLEFEIAPGLSINKIFNIVLVIGVLLWFITLLI